MPPDAVLPKSTNRYGAPATSGVSGWSLGGAQVGHWTVQSPNHGTSVGLYFIVNFYSVNSYQNELAQMLVIPLCRYARVNPASVRLQPAYDSAQVSHRDPVVTR